MTAEPSKNVLSREQISQALAVLRQAQQAHPISAAQRKHFFWYGISVWGFFVLLVVMFILIFSPSLEAELFRSGWQSIFFGLFGGSAIAVVLLFFWNIKLILHTWREFRVAFRTKLWQLMARTRPGRRWPRRLMIGFGVCCLAFFLAAAWMEPIIFPLTIALLAFFLLRFARRRLAVLGNADQLVAFLTKLEASEGPAGIDQVAIPTTVFKEMEAIEDLHIQHRRAKAIDEFSQSNYGYAVLKSRAVIAEIAKLDEPSKLRVEACIAQLASESSPPDTLHESGGVCRIPVKETPYEIVCRQDKVARRIELLSLEQGDGTSSSRQTAEAPHG